MSWAKCYIVSPFRTIDLKKKNQSKQCVLTEVIFKEWIWNHPQPNEVRLSSHLNHSESRPLLVPSFPGLRRCSIISPLDAAIVAFRLKIIFCFIATFVISFRHKCVFSWSGRLHRELKPQVVTSLLPTFCKSETLNWRCHASSTRLQTGQMRFLRGQHTPCTSSPYWKNKKGDTGNRKANNDDAMYSGQMHSSVSFE